MVEVFKGVVIDLEQSINRAFDDMKKIETGKLPKRSYKYMIKRVKMKLDKEKK